MLPVSEEQPLIFHQLGGLRGEELLTLNHPHVFPWGVEPKCCIQAGWPLIPALWSLQWDCGHPERDEPVVGASSSRHVGNGCAVPPAPRSFSAFVSFVLPGLVAIPGLSQLIPVLSTGSGSD